MTTPTFKVIEGSCEEAIWITKPPLPKYNVTEDAFPGFIIQRVERWESEPLFIGSLKLFSQLTYGNRHPDLILSSEKAMKHMVACIKWDQRKPVMYGCNFGFLFNGIVWSHPENTGVEIDGEWVFMLNRKYPTEPKLNGCMKVTRLEFGCIAFAEVKAARDSSCHWTLGYDGDESCRHDWMVGDAQILTYPAKQHRECARCGRRECREVQEK